MLDSYFSSQQYILRLLDHNALVAFKVASLRPSFMLHQLTNSSTLATTRDADVMIDESYM